MFSAARQLSGTTLRAMPPSIVGHRDDLAVGQAVEDVVDRVTRGELRRCRAPPCGSRCRPATAAPNGRRCRVKVQVALMFPTQPACSVLAVGSITIARSAVAQAGLALEQRGQRAVAERQLLAAEEDEAEVELGGGRRGERELDHHRDRAEHVGGAEPVDAPLSIQPGRLSCAGHGVEVAGERARAGARHASVVPARTQVSPASRARSPSTPRTCATIACLVARLRRDVDQLEGAGSEVHASGNLLAVRYCGIDVSARPGNQQLCTLHERRGAEGPELVATFYEPGTVEQVARTVLGFGGEAVVAVDAPSGRRLDLLRAGCAAARRARAARRVATRRCASATRCSFRRRLPLYPGAVGRAGAEHAGSSGSASATSSSRRWRRSGSTAPRRAGVRGPARRRRAALRPARGDLPRRGVLRLARATGRRPSERRGACSSGSPRCGCAASWTTTAASGTARWTSSTRAQPPTRPTPSPTAPARGSAIRAKA